MRISKPFLRFFSSIPFRATGVVEAFLFRAPCGFLRHDPCASSSFWRCSPQSWIRVREARCCVRHVVVISWGDTGRTRNLIGGLRLLQRGRMSVANGVPEYDVLTPPEIPEKTPEARERQYIRGDHENQDAVQCSMLPAP